MDEEPFFTHLNRGFMAANHILLLQGHHNTTSRIKVGEVRGDFFRVDSKRCMYLDVTLYNVRLFPIILQVNLRGTFRQNSTNNSVIDGHFLYIFNKVDIQDILSILSTVHK